MAKIPPGNPVFLIKNSSIEVGVLSLKFLSEYSNFHIEYLRLWNTEIILYHVSPSQVIQLG